MTHYTHRDLVKKELVKFADLNIKSGMKVLEIGGGITPFREFFEERGCTWFDVDKERESHESRKQALMEDLSFIEDNTYDILFSCHAFEHCERPVDALREFARVLKKEGKIFMATPNPCEHHILKADPDHIMVLFPMQLARLFVYIEKFKDIMIQTQTEGIHIEQDYNIISTATKS